MALGHLSLEGHPGRKKREGRSRLKNAIVTAAAVVGSLLRIAQTRYWCEWFLEVLNSYWGREPW